MTRITALARKALTILLLALFGGLAALPTIQIFLRLFGRPFVGAEELTRFFLICLVFLSFPLVTASGENIAMGEFKAMFPAAWRKALDLIIVLCSLGIAGFIAYAAWQTMMNNLKNVTPTLNIPFWLFLASTFFAFLGAAVVHFHELAAYLFGAGKIGASPSSGAPGDGSAPSRNGKG